MDSCHWCEELERTTLPDTGVEDILRNFILAKTNINHIKQGSNYSKKYYEMLKPNSYPRIIDTDKQDNEKILGEIRGYRKPGVFIGKIQNKN